MKKLLLPASAFFRRTAGLFVLLYLSLTSVNAQQPGSSPARPLLAIRGRNANDKGRYRAGASIKLKKGNRGTSTDSSGHLALMARQGDELIISYIGFTQSQYIISDPPRDINIFLKALPGSNLNDVIVVGYGTHKKANVLAAVSGVKAEHLVVTKNENVVNMLTGKMPRMRIQQMSSEPAAFNTQY